MIKGYWSALVFFGGFLALIFAVKLVRRTARIPSARKAFHMANGVMCLTLPWMSERWEPIALASAAAVILIAGMRVYRRRRSGCDFLYDTSGLDSFGELLFPVTVLLLTVVTRLEPLMFVAPMAVLTFADSSAALVGSRFGRTNISPDPSNRKTLAGTHAFFGASFVSLALSLALLGTGSLARSVVISLTLSSAAAAAELYSKHGFDNLTVPAAVWLMLKLLPGLDSAQLLAALAAAALLPPVTAAVAQFGEPQSAKIEKEGLRQ